MNCLSWSSNVIGAGGALLAWNGLALLRAVFMGGRAGRGGGVVRSGSTAFLIDRLMRPVSSMPMTFTLTSCPSSR